MKKQIWLICIKSYSSICAWLLIVIWVIALTLNVLDWRFFKEVDKYTHTKLVLSPKKYVYLLEVRTILNKNKRKLY